MRLTATILFLTASIIFTTVCGNVAVANKLKITNVPVLNGRDPITHTVRINFGLKWENSWRTTNPANYDAVWVFCKYWSGSEWHHVLLSNDSAQHKVIYDSVHLAYSDPSFQITAEQQKDPISVELGKSSTWLFPEGTSMTYKGNTTDNDTVINTVGIFLYRKYNGKSSVTIGKNGISLLWEYGKQNIADDDPLSVRVFAIEMIYVPKGKFWIGDKQSTGSGRFSFSKSTLICDPFEITSEAAIDFDIAGGTNKLTFVRSAIPAADTSEARKSIATSGIIPAEFPKGFQAFYIMKYELTQQAYCDFLNTLTFDQQNSFVEANINSAVVNKSPMDNGAANYIGVGSWPGGVNEGLELTYVAWPWGFRYGIVYKTIGSTLSFGCNLDGDAVIDKQIWLAPDSLGADGQDVAVTFVSFYDLVRYADFAGLRPMTEFEYEKACRGPASPVANEYAWGGVFIKAYGADPDGPYHWNATSNTPTSYYANVLSNPMRGNEKLPAAYNATNIHYLFTKGSGSMAAITVPSAMRVGAFATETSNRQAAGASYWGVMNMSDNVAELCYTPTTAQGRYFNGTHGGGEITSTGEPMHKADLATEWNYTYKDHWNGNYYTTASSFDSLFVPRGCLTSRSFNWGTSGNSHVDAFNTWRASMAQDLRSGRVADRLYSLSPYNGKERKEMLLHRFAKTSDAKNTGWVSYLPGIRCVRTQNAPM
ncbi:hypothetical protein FACS1894153_0060 [Bacteroidia bacterium]|nr:hypothetical protein FACS1894153_0060 [Bacteroidia bacterium]